MYAEIDELRHDTDADLPVQQLASHGLMNVMVEAEGDTWIDDHHTCEDIGRNFSCTFSLLFCIAMCE